MSKMTLDPHVLMKKWMEIYMNLNLTLSTNPAVSKTLDEMKDKLAECNEWVMRFFDMVGANPELG